MVSDVLRWIGLGPLSTSAPIPAAPMPRVIELLWLGLRRIEYRFANDYPTAVPHQISQIPAGGIVTGAEPVKVTGAIVAADPDGDRLTYTVVTQPRFGTVVVNADGTYTYEVTAPFAHVGGADSFTVVVDDTVGNPWHLHRFTGLLGLTGPPTITVPVTVAAVNRAPTATAQITDLDPDADGVATGTVGGADADTDPLSYTVSGQPSYGTATVDASGKYTYAAFDEARHAILTTDGAATEDPFTITTSDGVGGQATTTVTVTLTPFNQDPAATPSASEPSSSGVVRVNPNATDPDGDAVTVTVALAADDANKGFLARREDGTYDFIATQAAMNASFGAESPGNNPEDRYATVTITVEDEYGGVYTTDVEAEVLPYFVISLPLTVIVGGISVGSSGITVYDPVTASWTPSATTGSVVTIPGTSYSISVDEAGTQLTVTGLEGSTSFSVGADIEYTIGTTDDGHQALYANSALMMFFNLL